MMGSQELKPKVAVNNKAKIPVTEVMVSMEELPQYVRKKFKIISPEILSAELRYIPCWWVVLDFSVTFFSKTCSNEGRLDFIVDQVKGCGVADNPKQFKMAKVSVPESIIIKENMTDQQAEKRAIVDARWKVLMARFKKPPELETAEIRRFYRPYYDVAYTYGKEVKKQWVSADGFGSYFMYS